MSKLKLIPLRFLSDAQRNHVWNQSGYGSSHPFLYEVTDRSQHGYSPSFTLLSSEDGYRKGDEELLWCRETQYPYVYAQSTTKPLEMIARQNPAAEAIESDVIVDVLAATCGDTGGYNLVVGNVFYVDPARKGLDRKGRIYAALHEGQRIEVYTHIPADTLHDLVELSKQDRNATLIFNKLTKMTHDRWDGLSAYDPRPAVQIPGTQEYINAAWKAHRSTHHHS